MVRTARGVRARFATVSLLLLAAIAPAASGAREPGDEQVAQPVAPTPEATPPPPVDGKQFGEEIVVTGNRTPRPLRDAPEAVTVLPRAEIDRSPTKTVDELLRIVPSFGLFRRTSSVVSDPSAQGVNLRGIGPSGVSRSLVLVDGIPANDPFGGWVYWRAIPRLGIDRIEVVPGGGSAVYGNYALGGVTQIFSRPTARGLAATTECGSFNPCLLGGRAASDWGPIGGAVEADFLRSDGYPVVAPNQRGLIDADTPSQHATVTGRVEARATPELSFSARGGYFHENENGGTQFTTASVKRLEYAATARYAPAGVGAFDLAVFGHRGEFGQQRAAIASKTPDGQSCQRCGETQAAVQDVPTHDVGGSLLWRSRPLPLGGTHTLLVGADAIRITGETREDFPSTASVLLRDANGGQRLYGVFLQDVYDVSEAIAGTFALRYDHWENTEASRFELGKGASPAVTFPRHGGGEVSPKVGLRVHLTDRVTVRAAAYRAFRAPTLNELYRPFQVGTVRTNANEGLRPETLDGAETGLEVAIARGVRARVTGFWSELHDPILNVTLAPANPNLRQRQNLGQARIRGVEADLACRLGRAWIATAAYTLADSRITEAPGQPQLVGQQLPQDPRHKASLSLAFDDRRFLSAVAQVRYVGRQFEDDLNTLPMAEVVLVDLAVSRMLTPVLDAFFAVENLLDRTYLVGRAGVDTLGQPRFLRAGLRWRYGG